MKREQANIMRDLVYNNSIVLGATFKILVGWLGRPTIPSVQTVPLTAGSGQVKKMDYIKNKQVKCKDVGYLVPQKKKLE